MEKMQVVTLRMTEQEIAQLEELAKCFRYYKRSDIIRAACQFMTTQMNRGGQHQILAGYGRQWKDYHFVLEVADLKGDTQRYSK